MPRTAPGLRWPAGGFEDVTRHGGQLVLSLAKYGYTATFHDPSRMEPALIDELTDEALATERKILAATQKASGRTLQDGY